jgi:hypothetical protein
MRPRSDDIREFAIIDDAIRCIQPMLGLIDAGVPLDEVLLIAYVSGALKSTRDAQALIDELRPC